jgi:hypothetical protein
MIDFRKVYSEMKGDFSGDFIRSFGRHCKEGKPYTVTYGRLLLQRMK